MAVPRTGRTARVAKGEGRDAISLLEVFDLAAYLHDRPARFVRAGDGQRRLRNALGALGDPACRQPTLRLLNTDGHRVGVAVACSALPSRQLAFSAANSKRTILTKRS
jgi:hypothetical protein